jgi:hypothetical protein
MDVLECINKPIREKYYDKADWEEDECLAQIPMEIMDKFEKLESHFEKLCEGVEVSEAAKISSSEREEKNIHSNDFIYGEIVRILLFNIKNNFEFIYRNETKLNYNLN